MKPVTFKDLKAKVSYDKHTQDVLVLTNIPYTPILSDSSLSSYTEFDFGYLRLSFVRDSDYVTFRTNSSSPNKLIVLKRACSVASNFVTYSTLDKVLLHRCVLWSSPKSKTTALRNLKHRVVTEDLDLKKYALKTFPAHVAEIRDLESQLKGLHVSMLRLAVKLHLASGSKDVGYLNNAAHSALQSLKAKGRL